MQISYRPARPEDCQDLARFLCMAGGGLYEFLFDDLIPFMSAQDIVSAGAASDRYPISYRNWRVATLGEDGKIVGAANVFPADDLKHDNYRLLNSERYDRVRPMMTLQDWGSMFLNALAVDAKLRGGGIGAQLLAWAKARATELGFDRLSLHAWADNIGAMKFYETHGFVRLGVAEIAPHPRLRHVGGSILMRWSAH
jgi:GNAT superfamily N-acetyltransferase